MIPYDRLSQIVPADQALACKAISVSLNQIAGITTMTSPSLATVVSGQETTRDLPLISALTVAVPPAVANYFTSNVAVGTGTGNSIVICDVLGTASGFVSAPALGNTISRFSTMDLASLTTIYYTMAQVASGIWTTFVPLSPTVTTTTIPAGYPAAGTYASQDLAIQALIPLAQAEIADLIVRYPTQTSAMNTDWNNMATQLTLEKQLQAQAGLNFANLVPNSTSSMYSFVFNMNSYGNDTQVGGQAQLIEGVGDLTTFTGQAVIAAMREGRNQIGLQSVGITTNGPIPADPNPPPLQANLIPSTYTAQQAANIVVV